MVFSVSNDVIEWFLVFGPESVTLTVEELFHELTISSQEFRRLVGACFSLKYNGFWRTVKREFQLFLTS